MPQPVFEILIFMILSLILDFQKVAFISVYTPKCLCRPYLFAECYLLHAVIGFWNFVFFYIDFGRWKDSIYRFVGT